MKKFKFICGFILIIFAIYHFEIGGKIFLLVKQEQNHIMKNILLFLKKERILLLFIATYSYGVIHSLTPGHGKMMILNSNNKNSNFNLLKNITFLSYGQGIISYLIVQICFFFFTKLPLKEIRTFDRINFKIYGILLLILGIYEILKHFREHHKKELPIAILGFFPCSGIITILLTAKMIIKDSNLIFITFIFSSGIFTGLLAVMLFKNFLRLFIKKNSSFFEELHNCFGILYIIIGFYLIAFY